MMQEGAVRATATRRTSSSSRTPTRPSPRWPPTSSCRPRCGSRRKAPTATPSGARSSGTSWSTRRASRAPTSGSWWSSRKRFKVEEVWPAELLAKKPRVRGKTLYDVLYRNGQVDQLPVLADRRRLRERRGEGLRLLRAEGPVRGVRRVRPRPRPRPRALRHLPRGARPALAGGRRQGDALALQGRHRSLRQGRHRLAVLRQRRQPRT